MISSFKQYLVEEEREIFFTFGRMNPPTTGHQKLLDALGRKAGRNAYKVFLSQTSDPKKNPLSYEQKIKHARKMFPKHGRNILLNKKIKSVFDAATNLYEQGYKKVTMVVGSDRITEFNTLLNKYNGVKGKHGFYNFERIRVISAGDRDPDADDVSGMSASKQRQNAKNNDFTSFSQGVPRSFSNNDAKKLFNDVRVGMGMKESKDFKQHLDLGKLNETREKYINGELFEPGDRVVIKENGKAGYIYRLGANYVIVALDEGRVSRQWLDGIVYEKKTDRWYKDQPEWGTPESTKKAKKITPNEQAKPSAGQDPIDRAKTKIDKEKRADAVRHDKILDRARLRKVRKINRDTVPESGFNPKDMVTFRDRSGEGSRNPVAKYARKFNKASVHTDKKKAAKRGYKKHKKQD